MENTNEIEFQKYYDDTRDDYTYRVEIYDIEYEAAFEYIKKIRELNCGSGAWGGSDREGVPSLVLYFGVEDMNNGAWDMLFKSLFPKRMKYVRARERRKIPRKKQKKENEDEDPLSDEYCSKISQFHETGWFEMNDGL